MKPQEDKTKNKKNGERKQERRVTGRERGDRKKDGGELEVSGRVLRLAIP